MRMIDLIINNQNADIKCRAHDAFMKKHFHLSRRFFYWILERSYNVVFVFYCIIYEWIINNFTIYETTAPNSSL